jgi:hypothetical protein
MFFHLWNSPPELINFALTFLPDRIYAIPGQHDLPLHSYDNLEKSAYWTLVKAGKIINLTKPIEIAGAVPLRIRPFPYGYKVTPNESPHDLAIEIALVHQYVWTKTPSGTTGYENAPAENRVAKMLPSLRGYDVAVFGDNHISFTSQPGDGETTIYNCGGFYRRNADQIDHKPSVGMLHRDGTVSRHFLDCSKDVFLSGGKPSNNKDRHYDLSEFMEELITLESTFVDFAEAVKRFLDSEKIGGAVKQIILEILEKGKS